MSFNDEIYKPLINEILDDIYYKDTHFRTKIALLRHYLEIIVRKLVNYPSNKQMTLGAKDIERLLGEIENKVGIKDEHVKKTIKRAGRFLNKYNHTQHLVSANEESLTEAEDLVFSVVSLFFIIFFVENEFGLDVNDMESFSILPPVIRLKVLKYLYEEDTKNLFLIHKYLLVILKAENKDAALRWVKKRKKYLQSVSTISDKYNFDEFLLAGEKKFNSKHENMYDHLIFAIEHVSNQRNKKEVLVYSSFEQAVCAYTKVCEDEENLASFNKAKYIKGVIEFLFIGRESIK